METEVIVGFLLAVVVFGLSIFVISKVTKMPTPTISQPQISCPQKTIELTEDNFEQYLQAASSCNITARVKFTLTDGVLDSTARNLGLLDKAGAPAIIKKDDCELPFKALLVCNGTVFPGDLVQLYTRQATIIQKIGR